MSLYINDNLNDSTHVGNLKVKETKSEVLEKVKEFDKWYRTKTGGVEYQDTPPIWNIGHEIDVDDESRISFLKDSIIPRIWNCDLISDRLKDKAKKNTNVDDPGNVGVILTGSEYGKSLRKITYMFSEHGYIGFHERYLLNDDEHEEGVDTPIPRNITYEEAKFYHLSFIKLLSDDKAVYRVIINLTNGNPVYHEGFLILELIKDEGEWLVDDMCFLQEEELIERETFGYTLLDYFSNKEAYETGIPKQ